MIGLQDKKEPKTVDVFHENLRIVLIHEKLEVD